MNCTLLVHFTPPSIDRTLCKVISCKRFSPIELTTSVKQVFFVAMDIEYLWQRLDNICSPVPVMQLYLEGRTSQELF